MDPLSQVFCLRWNNHRNNLLAVFDHLLQTEAFCDVTLACDSASIKCHKMILSACSSYFQTLFMENTCEHPIVFLKDIKYGEIRAILDYMYKGEVNVAQEELPGLLKVAELLKVKGLVEEEREKLLNPDRKESRPVISCSEPESGRERSASTGGDRPSNDKESSPVTSGAGGVGPMGVRPFMYSPQSGGPQFPMWPLPGLFPGGAPHLFGNGGGNDKDGPGTPKRKKTASGSGGSTSSKESGLGSLPPLPMNGPNGHGQHRDENSHRDDHDKDKDNGLSPMDLGHPDGDKSGIANYVPNQRLEWKRYKQYTRNDIMSAIEEVKKGMSALQASRKFGVPSRTLYDKVKKMGITTGRQMQRKSLPQYPASFPNLPSLGMLGNYSESFKDLPDRAKDTDDSMDNSLHAPDDDRATLVPTTSAFPTIQMLNLMEKLKEGAAAQNGKKDGDKNSNNSPINLSTMLSNVGSRDLKPRPAGSDGSAHSPRSAASSPTPPALQLNDDKPGSPPGQTIDIRAQFMADLRRLGGHIPSTPPSTVEATSTTESKSPTSESDLPPRKRKVSQEHHGFVAPPPDKANGLHDKEKDDDGLKEENAPAAVNSSTTSLECRN